jgi:outer membrane protein assembly factor BamB
MGLLIGRLLALAFVAVIAAFHFPPLPKFPLFHRKPATWTQFRNGPDNNVVLGGSLETSWRVETGGQISSSPTVADGTLYIGNNNGQLYAIDTTSGHVRWMAHVINPLMSAPLIYNGSIIVGEGDPTSQGSTPSEPIMVGQGPSYIIAFDQQTGKMRWQMPMKGSAMPTPAIIDDILVDHDGAGRITGLDPSTGHKHYQRSIGSMASMTAVLPVGGGEFVTAGVGTNAVWRLNAHDGSTVWKNAFDKGVSGIGDCPPVSDGSRVFCDYVAPVDPDTATVVGNSATERVYAIDLASGKRAWDIGLEIGTLPERNEAAIPLLADGLLYLGSSMTPTMHALDTGTGEVAWTMQTRGPVKGGIVDVDGIVYFGDLGGYLWALDAKTGQVVGDKFMKTKFNVGSPIVLGRTLIIGSDSGTVFAVPLQDIRSSHDS